MRSALAARVDMWKILLFGVASIVGLFFFATRLAVATTVSPLRQTIVVEAGVTSTVEMEVTNTEEQQYIYSFDVESFSLDPITGAPVFYKDESVHGWVQPRVDPLLIGPGQTKTATFDIYVPSGAPSTSQYLALFARQRTDGSGNIQVVSRVGSLLFLHVAHEPVLSLQVVELDAPNVVFSGRVAVKSVVQNQGTIHVSPFGFVEMLGRKGEQLQQYPLMDGQQIILPYDRREFETLLEQLTWKDIGKRTVQTVFLYGEDQQHVASATVWFIPWYFPTVAVLILFFALFFIYGWRR